MAEKGRRLILHFVAHYPTGEGKYGTEAFVFQPRGSGLISVVDVVPMSDFCRKGSDCR